jgi:hypothetical protein
VTKAEEKPNHELPVIKPRFLPWTDWILDGDAVTYSTAGYGSAESPSACQWLIPNTGQNRG